MSSTLPYKHYSRTPRSLITEAGFTGGMFYTDNPLEENYVKTLVNFNYKDDGKALVPRGGFRVLQNYLVPSEVPLYPFAAYTTNVDILNNAHLEDYRTRCFMLAAEELAAEDFPEYAPERRAVLFPNQTSKLFIQDPVSNEFAQSSLVQKLPQPVQTTPIVLSSYSTNLQLTHKTSAEISVSLDRAATFKVTSATPATVTAVAAGDFSKFTVTAVAQGGPIVVTVVMMQGATEVDGTAVTHTVFVYPADATLPPPPVAETFDDTQSSMSFLGEAYNTAQSVHGLPLSATGPRKPIYTTLSNVAYALYRQDADNTMGLGRIKIVKDNSHFVHKIEPVIPITLSVKEVLSAGYNMLLPEPYMFRNQEASGYTLEGILPYGLNQTTGKQELLLSARPGQTITFEAFYQYKREAANIRIRARWEWIDPNDTTGWQLLQTELANNTANPAAVVSPDYIGGDRITVDFAPTVSQFQLRVSLYLKTGTTIATTPLKVMVMPVYTLSTTNSKNIRPTKYNLATAAGMATWKQRVVLWGVSGAENILFTSDINNPAYFPYPNNIEIFDENIVHVQEYLDNLLVVTETKLYLLTLGEDGIGFVTQLIQSRLGISPMDKHVIQVVKNMIFFKSDNYYYMVVPKANSIRGELIIAPISNPIMNLLDNFEEALREILDTLYVAEIPSEYELALQGYHNYVDNTTVRNVYTLQIFPPEDTPFPFPERTFNFVLNYDTTLRTWTTHLYQCNYTTVSFKQTITDSSVLLDTCNSPVGEGYEVNAQLLRSDPLVPEDGFALEAPRLFANYQYIDTGYRDQGVQHQKRFREIQFRVNNTSQLPLDFYTEFILDDSPRRTYYKYEVQHEIDPANPNFGLIYVARTLEPSLTVPGTTILNSWRIDMDKLPTITLVKVRFPVSGKGYAPRLKLVSFNERPYEFLNLNWVFRTMYAR